MSTSTDYRNLRRGGFYWEDNVPYVSVTTVLKVLDKPQLTRWQGKLIYRALLTNPELSEEEALGAPFKKSREAMSRGTTVHKIVENYVHEQNYIDQASIEYRPYAQAFYNFITDFQVELIEHEKTLVSKTYGYAGTLDLLARFKNSGRTFILDVKTGKDVYEDYFLQLSAYKQALFENEGIDANMGIILLSTGQDDKPTGNYKFVEANNCFDVFLATKHIWEWKNRELVTSVNYGEYPYIPVNPIDVIPPSAISGTLLPFSEQSEKVGEGVSING